ncbi:MAG TPA: gamma-glutamyltransferase [Solirubrobacteraceae bacterium]|nr:gamma-glutamyltransferase [Solirubrobacteraceae bacterium]
MSQQISKVLGTRAEVQSDAGVVSAGNEPAVRAGLTALEAGGNAIDAIVAGAFAAFVAEPNNASIGGYGHLSVYQASAGGGSFFAVDHGPRAPAAARADMYDVLDGPLDGHDWPSVAGDRNYVGGSAVAVPGAVPGLWAAHQRAGRLPWARLLEPAIALARAGVEVTWVLQIEIANRLPEIVEHPALAAILLPEGRVPRSRTADGPGERIDQRALARTLEAIAARGPDALHRGETADAIVRAIAGDGGIVTAEDLAAYVPVVLDEPAAGYRDLRYITCRDTVGYETLGILEHFDLAGAGAGSAAALHLLAEATGHAFADAASYADDPDLAAEPIAELGGAEFAAARAAAISPERAVPRPIAATAPWLSAGDAARPRSAGGVHGTTQVVAADRDGNLAALITTIGADFGSLVAVPEAGIILNNSMVNYDPRPGRSNSIAPHKMPFFAVPAIVAARDGRAAFAAAGAGGYAILAAVIAAMVGYADHGLGPQAAIDVPRVHSQGNRTFVDSRAGPEAIAGLRARGHDVVVQDVAPGELPFGRVSAVAVARGDGDDRAGGGDRDRPRLSAGAGPGWNTAAGGL